MEILSTNFLLLLPFILLLPLYLLSTLKSRNNGNQYKPNFPPGPPKLLIVGNLHQIGKPNYQTLPHLSKIYGPVMLLQIGSAPTVVISSAKDAEQVMKTHDLEFCNRIQFAGRKRVTYDYLDMTFTHRGEYWREIRKICILELFSMKKVQSFKAVRAEEIDVLMDSISSSSSNTTPVNVFEKSTSFTLKTICRVAFGCTASESRNIFDNGRLTKILYEVGMLNGYHASDYFPKVGWIIDRITGIHAKTEKCFHELDDFFQQIISEHENPKRVVQEEDIIDVLLKIKKDQTSTIHLTDDHIKAIVLNIFLGGVDTSAVTVSWALLELVKNPKEMKKVQEEIRDHVGSKGKVEESDLDNFRYLKMVVKETLRLHPGGPFITRECNTHSKIDGYDIYPKTKVLINAWAIGRNPEYWKNPLEFLPERFKDSSIDFVGTQNFDYLPFGGGRRVCPAINMGIVLTELILANVLYTFNWGLPKGSKMEDLNMNESPGSKYPLELLPIKHTYG